MYFCTCLNPHSYKKGENDVKNTIYIRWKDFLNPTDIGEMLEWLKRHAWKACKPLKGFAGSNPAFSAEKTAVANSYGRLFYMLFEDILVEVCPNFPWLRMLQ